MQAYGLHCQADEYPVGPNERLLHDVLPLPGKKLTEFVLSSRLLIGKMMTKTVRTNTLDISKVHKMDEPVTFSCWTYAKIITILPLPVRVG